MRRGLVPEVEMPHLKAICLRAAAFRVLGMVVAIHVRLCGLMLIDVSDWNSNFKTFFLALLEPCFDKHDKN